MKKLLYILGGVLAVILLIILVLVITSSTRRSYRLADSFTPEITSSIAAVKCRTSKGLDYVKDVTYHSKPFTISATAVCRDSTIVIFDIPPE